MKVLIFFNTEPSVPVLLKDGILSINFYGYYSYIHTPCLYRSKITNQI